MKYKRIKGIYKIFLQRSFLTRKRHTFIFSVPGHSVSQICSFRSPSGNPFSSPISVFHFHSFFRSSFSISLIDPHILHFMLREILFPASSISLVQIHFQFSIFIFILFFAVWNSRFWCNRCLLWLCLCGFLSLFYVSYCSISEIQSFPTQLSRLVFMSCVLY